MEQLQTQDQLVQLLLDKLADVRRVEQWLRELIHTLSVGTPIPTRPSVTETQMQALWLRYRDTPTLTVKALASETGIEMGALRRAFLVMAPDQYPAVASTRQGVGPRKRSTDPAAFYQKWLDLKRPTLREMGDLHEISHERVRQILSQNPAYERDIVAARRSRYQHG